MSVIRIADGANRGGDAQIGGPLRVAKAGVLGGFKWSLQRLDGEELRWKVEAASVGSGGAGGLHPGFVLRS
jgi:hypothetical protein